MRIDFKSVRRMTGRRTTYEGDDEGKKSDLGLFLVVEIEIEIEIEIEMFWTIASIFF